MTVIAKAGRYELLEEIGRGAMGVVYRAHDPVIGRTVAVKTLRVSEHSSGLSSDELLRRFHTEARAAGLLSHPNIVAVYDAGKEEEFFYITMELVQGKSLQALLGERHAFPLARVLRLMQQACAALEFAHQNNVVHRDIKPANLILTPDDTLKISDFGTAKILQYQTAQTGQIVGTPSYMSPEQIKGRPVDGRSDIFSLGAALYELLTGSKPFPGDSITSVIYKIMSEDPAPPRELDSSIHPGLSAIVLRALAKPPEARFQSCVQFFDALQNYRDYQPGNAAPTRTETPNRFAAQPEESTTVPRELLAQQAQPAKSGNSVWLALLLLGVIGFSGYKVWPPLQELWFRDQPQATAVLPGTNSDANSDSSVAAGSDSGTDAAGNSAAAAADTAPVASTPIKAAAPAITPTVVAQPIVESKPPVATPLAASSNRLSSPPRRVAVSQVVADWNDHVVGVLTEAGLADKVHVVAAGSTLTLLGRLEPRAHRTLLGLLQDGPAEVQFVDHIEDVTAQSSPSPATPAPPVPAP